MSKKRIAKGIEDDEIKEELGKTIKDKKIINKKMKTSKTKKDVKIKPEVSTKIKKQIKKKRKLNKLNVFVIIFSIIFALLGIIAVLYGIGVLTLKIKNLEPTYYNLSEKVKVGDYVNYDAGNWEEDKEIPNKEVPYTFGGYENEVSRNDGVTCNYNDVENSGWRVFNISRDSVTLIQSGLSMCYYHEYGNLTNETSVNILNNSTEDNKFDYFLDGKFGESVRILSKEDIDKFIEIDSSYTRISDDLIDIGNPYWLATANETHYMWYVTEGGTVAVDHVGTYGVRVLVTLKDNTQTTGQNKEGVWILAEEVKKDE